MDTGNSVGTLRGALTDLATRLQARRLQVARGVWVATVPLSLAVFIAALPARYDQLRAEMVHDRLQIASMRYASLPQPLAAWLTSRLYAPLMLGLEIVVMTVCAATAVLLFWRRHDERMAIAASLSLVGYGVLFLPPLDALALAHPAWSMLAHVIQGFGLDSSLLIFYVSPDGHFVPCWTRPLAVLWTAWTLASVVVPSAPFDFLHGRPHVVTPQTFGLAWLLACLAWYGTGVLAQVVRYRRVSTPRQRQQTKWVVIGWAAVIAFYAALVVPRVTIAALSAPGPIDLLYRHVGAPSFEVVLLLSPIPIAISALRYRLWDVDMVINRALVYGLVTLTLGFFYLASVITLEAVFRWVTGQGSPLAIVVSTLASAWLFLPVRRRMQSRVDRRFYRRKYDAIRLIQEFGRSERDEVDLDVLIDKLTTVVQESIQPTHVSLVLLPVPREVHSEHTTPEPDNPTNAASTKSNQPRVLPHTLPAEISAS
jgi:hypothetical protein